MRPALRDLLTAAATRALAAGHLSATEPPPVAIDFETFYRSARLAPENSGRTACSVATAGNWAYCRHKEFDAYLVALYSPAHPALGLAEIGYVGPPAAAPWALLRGRRWLSHHRNFDRHVFERLLEDCSISMDTLPAPAAPDPGPATPPAPCPVAIPPHSARDTGAATQGDEDTEPRSGGDAEKGRHGDAEPQRPGEEVPFAPAPPRPPIPASSPLPASPPLPLSASPHPPAYLPASPPLPRSASPTSPTTPSPRPPKAPHELAATTRTPPPLPPVPPDTPLPYFTARPTPTPGASFPSFPSVQNHYAQALAPAPTPASAEPTPPFPPVQTPAHAPAQPAPPFSPFPPVQSHAHVPAAAQVRIPAHPKPPADGADRRGSPETHPRPSAPSAENPCASNVSPALPLLASPLPPAPYTDWHDTADLAVYCHLPRALGPALATAYGLALDKSARTEMDGRRYADLAPAEQERLRTYALEDAAACCLLWLDHAHRWPEEERYASLHTGEIEFRGIAVDRARLADDLTTLRTARDLAMRAIPWYDTTDADGRPIALRSPRALAHECRRCDVPAPDTTDVKSPAFQDWLDEYGDRVPAIHALARFRSIDRALGIYRHLEARLRPDGRAAVGLKYLGAEKTGRWSGAAGFNLQNLLKVPLYFDSGYAWLAPRPGPAPAPAGVAYTVDLRRCLVAAPGHVLIAPDLSQIEPRLLHWLTGNEPFLAHCRAGLSPYEAHARQSGHTWSGSLKKTSPALYALFKARVLALGYGAGWEKFIGLARGYCESEEQFLAIFAAEPPPGAEDRFLAHLRRLRDRRRHTPSAAALADWPDLDPPTRRIWVNAWTQVDDFRRAHPLLFDPRHGLAARLERAFHAAAPTGPGFTPQPAPAPARPTLSPTVPAHAPTPMRGTVSLTVPDHSPTPAPTPDASLLTAPASTAATLTASISELRPPNSDALPPVDPAENRKSYLVNHNPPLPLPASPPIQPSAFPSSAFPSSAFPPAGTYTYRLPSGRTLQYFDVTPAGSAGHWTARPGHPLAPPAHLYGGKLVENLVQALARDVFLLGLNRLARAGHRLLFHVHDEAIVEAPKGTGPAEIARLLTAPPPWAPTLPLASEYEVSEYYKK